MCVCTNFFTEAGPNAINAAITKMYETIYFSVHIWLTNLLENMVEARYERYEGRHSYVD